MLKLFFDILKYKKNSKNRFLIKKLAKNLKMVFMK